MGWDAAFLEVQAAEGQGEGLGARHLPPRVVDITKQKLARAEHHANIHGSSFPKSMSTSQFCTTYTCSSVLASVPGCQNLHFSHMKHTLDTKQKFLFFLISLLLFGHPVTTNDTVCLTKVKKCQLQVNMNKYTSTDGEPSILPLASWYILQTSLFTY